MSEESAEKTFSFRIPIPWIAILIVLAALTGNCSCLGFDRDYVGEFIDSQKGDSQ